MGQQCLRQINLDDKADGHIPACLNSASTIYIYIYNVFQIIWSIITATQNEGN